MSQLPDPDPIVVGAADVPVAQPHAQPQYVVADPVVAERTTVVSRRRWALDSVVVGIVGVALTIVGLIAIVRAGIESPFDDPVVDVLGLSHTAALGFVEVAIGVLLLICAASTWRAGAVFFGLLLVIGGAVTVAEPESLTDTFAVESAHGWVAIVTGAVVVAASLFVPRAVSTSARAQHSVGV
jgi:uncharacterized membrane protein